MGKQSAFDPGLLAVVAVMIAIPVAIVYLAMQASTTATPGDPASVPPAVRQPIPEPAAGLVRRGSREKIEREIEKAKAKLEQARLQRAQDPIGGWNEIIAATEREIAELRQRLEELDK